MRRITCENGLVFVAAIGLGLVITSARGGNLNPPTGPTNEASAMWTLENIYNVLDTRTTNVTLRPGGFTEPTNGPANGTMHTLNDIMTLVTNRAPVPKTGQTPMLPEPTPAGSDGNLQIGVAWPNPRFTVQGDTNSPNDPLTNCIRDNLTGLIWTRNANLTGTTNNWANAISYCTNMNSGSGIYGYTDWRLPNIRELFSLCALQFGSGAVPYVPAISDGTGTNQWTEALGPFTGIPLGDTTEYWSSTTATNNTTCAWRIWLPNVNIVEYRLKTLTAHVWPVRGGQ